MRRRSDIRVAVGTALVVAIALSVLSIQRARTDADAARGAQKAVRSQLDAFNHDDYRGAYRFAAPEIQEQFPLPEFRAMVKHGYPQIARSRTAVFGSAKVHGLEAVVPVTVTGNDGTIVRVLYLMRRVGEAWRVAGVEQIRPPGRPATPETAPRGNPDAA